MGYRYKSTKDYLLSRFGRGNVDDINQYKKITAGQAYLDMQPRTVKGLAKKEIESILEDLAEELFDYIHSPTKNEASFDGWHKDKCNWLINSVKSKANIPFTYGKAQKLINVSLKYIYCLDGAEKKLDKFEHCHMVLDSYTYSRGFYKDKIKSKKEKIISWSKIEKYNDYMSIQSNIREYIKHKIFDVDGRQIQLTPFEAEFIIFDKYKK